MLRRLARLIAAVTAATLILVPSAALAQESPEETGEIGNGTARATALVSRIGPGVGDLELAMRGGLAITQITNSVAQSTSHVLDLGLIGTALTTPNCKGNQAVHPDDLPQHTSVDNREGDASDSEAEGGEAGGPFSTGHKHASATEDPVSARAVTTGGNLEIAPGVGVQSGRAESITTVLPGEGREATAIVENNLNLGPVVLKGLRWRAYHRTGADPHAEAGFEVGSAEIQGIPFPTEELGPLEDAINTALAPMGTVVSFPRVQRFLEPNDLIRVTPMRIRMEDNPTTATLLGPVLTGSQEARSTFFETVQEQACELTPVLFVGDVVVSVAAGTGFLALDLGGAEASSGKFVIRNPFGSFPPPAVAVPETPITPAPTTAGPFTPGPASPSTPTVTTPTTQQEVAAPDTAPTASRGPMEKVCESIHPNGDSCADGAGLALGLLGVLTTIAVAGYEVRKQWPTSGGGS